MCCDSVSPVPRPARIPDLVSPQSDGVLHRTLNGPSAASRRAREEKSARFWLWCYTKISQWTAQTTRMFRYISIPYFSSTLCPPVCNEVIIEAHLIIILLLSRNGMKNGIESPVWPCGRLVWQHRTPQSRIGIISLRNSSLNHAPTKPMYIHAFLLPTWCSFHWIYTPTTFCLSYSLVVPRFHAY